MNMKKEKIPFWLEEECSLAEDLQESLGFNSPVIEEREFWGEIDIEFLNLEVVEE